MSWNSGLRRIAAGAVLSLSCAAVLAPAAARAAAPTANYTFTKLADTYGAHDSFSAASINNSGSVVYVTNLDGGGKGMYRYEAASAASPVTTPVTLTTGAGRQFSSIGPATIAPDGAIAFSGTLAANGTIGVFRQPSSAAPVSTLYTDASFGTLYDDHIAGSAVAFHATTEGSPSQDVIFLGDGSAPAAVVAGGANLQIFASSLAASASGTVGFHGGENVNGKLSLAVYTASATAPPTRIIDDLGPYEIFGNVSMSSNGTALVSAGPDGGSSGTTSPTHLVRIAPGGAPVVVADSDGLFKNFGIYAVNNAGRFATYSALDTPSTYGVFAGPDPIADRVLMTGDELFGETISLARITKQALNDQGQIVIRAQTMSGNEMLVLATPVPEPTSLAAAATALVCVTLRRRRRRPTQP